MRYCNKNCHNNTKKVYIIALILLHSTIPSLLLRDICILLLLLLHVFIYHYWSLLDAFYLVSLLLLLTNNISTLFVNSNQYLTQST
jgi:hypothetical protein